MAPAPWADDPTIAAGTVLWRRIAVAQLRVDDAGKVTPSDSAFRTQEMSVHIAELTSVETVLGQYPTHRIMAFTADLARSVGCVVVRDPVGDDPSHALVVRADGKSLSKAQAKQIALAVTWVVV